MVKLTPKQDAFVKAYLLNGGNATQAAISAGYSKKTANEQGAQNLAKLSIKEAIQEHQKEAKKDFIWSKEKKLELLQRIAKVAATEDGEKGMINMQSAIAAIKEHNLMQGDNAPVESNTNIKVDKPLSEMITGGSKR
jgi:phage terminase small subunit